MVLFLVIINTSGSLRVEIERRTDEREREKGCVHL